jgi:hypothetical protein
MPQGLSNAVNRIQLELLGGMHLRFTPQFCNNGIYNLYRDASALKNVKLFLREP